MNMYLEKLGDAGYSTFKLARANNRGDGILLSLIDFLMSVLNFC